MKLTVKTLKGEKFEIAVEDTYTVSQVKGVIESTKAELPSSTTKLIHSGKVLKDDDIIATCGIKESDFLVVMVTKPKKTIPPVETAAAVAAAAPSATASTTPTAAASESKAETSTSDTAATPAPTESTSTPAAPSRPTDSFPDEVVSNLTGMGFPEAEVRHCLRVAQGNPDIAVEYLTNGIPDGVTEATASAGAQTPASGGAPLQSLRNHPQFDALRRLVQSNPAMLQQVLTQIGQQQPELLQEINANQALFLQMMNEPVTEAISSNRSSTGSDTPRPDFAGGMMEGIGNPSQMAQMLQGMSPEQMQQMATMMGLPPEQFMQTVQAIGRLPPDQVNQFMMEAMGGAGEMMGGGGGGGSHVLHLTEEEMAAVDRLTEMGFDRSEAAQAFLACDKNEALAANLLMDSMGDSGFGGGFGGDGNDNDGNDDDDDENMYE